MKQRLTDKQLAVLCFARDFFRENDQLPTMRAVEEHFGTTNGEYPMRVLERKGYLEKNAVGKYRFARDKEE